MFATPSRLPEPSRARVAEALNASLADGIDLYTQAKTAHWNLKGHTFRALHEQFDELAAKVAEIGDEVAERLVTLGGTARGSARRVAQTSRLPELPAEASRDLDLVRILAERLEAHLDGLREARRLAGSDGDEDTVDLLTGAVRELEKQGWFLRATLER